MILVTGGTGLVGAHLLLSLAQGGQKLRALYRSEQAVAKTHNLFKTHNCEYLFADINWIKGDITDIPSLETAFERVEYVYHCAAFISFDPANEEKLRKVNIEGTANMVNLALGYGIKKFCHVSSVAALGDAKPGENTITENTEWNPEVNHSDYAISKYGAEMEVWRAYQEGLNVVVINPGIIFGSGFYDSGSGAMIKSSSRDQYFYTKGITGIIAIEDVVQIAIQLMKGDVTGERFTLVAENMGFDDMLYTIADSLNVKRPFIYATPAIAGMAWRLDWLLSKLFLKKRSFTKLMAKSAHNREYFDNSKIKNLINYTFLEMKEYIKKAAKDFTA